MHNKTDATFATLKHLSFIRYSIDQINHVWSSCEDSITKGLIDSMVEGLMLSITAASEIMVIVSGNKEEELFFVYNDYVLNKEDPLAFSKLSAEISRLVKEVEDSI